MKRLDIELSDVFISWTSEDKALKNAVKNFLRNKNLKCTDSEEACQGNFEEWSEEAARSSSVFLLILTDNSLYKSKYVPLETRSALKMDDAANRIVVVCPDMQTYRKERFGENGENILRDEHISVITCDGNPIESKLDEIYEKVTSLISNRFFDLYNKATAANYIELVPLYKEMQKACDRQFLYDDLYIGRTITETGLNGEEVARLNSPEDLISCGDIMFLSGSAGSGKTQYLKQIRHCLDDGTLMITLSCSKIANSQKPLFEDLYGHFRGKCGDRDFYSEDNFKRLLAVKKLLLVFDGMDEIPTEGTTRNFLEKLREFYEPNSDGITLLFTGRNEKDAGYIAFSGKKVRKFRLNKLTDGDIEKLGNNLFIMLGDKDKGGEFYVKVKDLSDEIKSNPLLLSQLAIVYNDCGEMPKTIVGIFDAVSAMILNRDSFVNLNIIPQEYTAMMENLSSLLKEFAAERYIRLSQGKRVTVNAIFEKLLKPQFAFDYKSRARFLAEYIQGRAIYIENDGEGSGEFYHKMFSEYFTAVYYYERAFDSYSELENKDAIKELFSHYSDPYWSKVLQLFLIKADSLIDDATTEDLYNEILSGNKIEEYTLLFDSCRDLIVHKEEAQTSLVCDILQKSVSGIYPPYGPLFWYVPEYDLYENALFAAAYMLGNAKALALVRDVCYIYGQKNNIKDITDKLSGQELFKAASASLVGVRRALCEIFYLGDTEFKGGRDIYPRCFNVAETLSFRDYSCGVLGRMETPFEDELGLYSHTSYNTLNGEIIGLVSCPYDIAEVEATLGVQTCLKLSGLIFTPTHDRNFKFMKFTRSSVKVLYVPENTSDLEEGYRRFMPLIFDISMSFCGEIMYLFGDVELPTELVTEGYCFKECTTLRRAKIPEGTDRIGERSFMWCSNLEEVIIPESVTQIEHGAFFGCKSLKKIKLPDVLKIIEDSAFYGCSNIKKFEIPDGIEEICQAAFENCEALEEINIPNGITKISSDLFRGCKSLKEIDVPDDVIEIGVGAFDGCESLNKIKIPDKVSVIAHWTFHGCINLKTITIPNGVTAIGAFAFKGCDNLISITIPERVTSISLEAFSGCFLLEDVTIPENVSSIAEGTFSNCKSLTTINIPRSVIRIGTCVFLGCKGLTKIEIPDSVKQIERDAFAECNNLKKVTIPKRFKDDVKYIGFSEDAEFIWKGRSEECKEREKTVYIKDGEAIISKKSYNDRGATRYVLPASAQVIGDKAFERCGNLKEIVVPESVTEIGKSAFAIRERLKKVVLPDGLTKIATDAFDSCRNLQEINIPKTVTKMGNGVFSFCDRLKEITIPDGIKTIGVNLFNECTGLEKVTLPDTVTKIGMYAFTGCVNLREIKIPDRVKKIEYFAFAYCLSLTEIKIPEGVKEIEDEVFTGCESLQEINIPHTVTKIGCAAFSECGLLHLKIPDKVTEIGDRAFEGCDCLTDIKIPESVAKIGDSAFAECWEFEEIVIPKGVIEIGNDAFYYCKNLKSVTISINFKNDIRRIFGDIDPSIIHFV